MEEPETNKLWINQFDSDEREIYFSFQEEAEYRDIITSFALSHHGYIMGIGFNTGEIFACDSRNFCNKHEYTTHKADVTAISFSRDSLHIASGDKTGFFQIHNVVTGAIELEKSFSSPIKSILFSNYDVDVLVILLTDGSLFLLNLTSKVWEPTNQKFSCIVWGSDPRNIIGGYRSEIIYCQLNEEKSKISISGKYGSFKDITSIVISNDKSTLLVLDSRGAGSKFSLDGGFIIGSYLDSINKTKFAYAAFSLDNRYSFLVNKTTSLVTFVTYSNVLGDIFSGTPIHSFRGLKEPVREIIPHPTRPIIFIRLKYEIYTWSYYRLSPLYNTVPEKGLMRENALYSERENEFDSSEFEEEEESKKQFTYEPLNLMKREPEGVLNIFPDDYKYPDQIYFLPYQHQSVTMNHT